VDDLTAAPSSDADEAPADDLRSPDGFLSAVGALSPLDRELIHALQADGRASYASLAAHVGVTEKIVRGRVNALRAAGVIDITTVTDPGALGYRYVSLIGIRATGVGSLQIATRLAHLEGVDYVVVTTGRYNLLVELFSRTLADLREVVDSRIQALPGVIDVEVYPYLSLYYQEGEFATVQAKPQRDLGRGEPVTEFDAIDKAIVNRLNANGRESFRTLGTELSISETQVRRRVARMQDAGALRVMAIANPMSLGFEVVAFVGVDCAPPASTVDVAEALSNLASVTYVAICAGRFNIWAEIVCTSMEDMLRILDSGVRQIAGVRAVEPFVYLDLQYRRVQPASSPSSGADRSS
jgi:Lrp/AsnC family transcriptional regulator for asnA, asnC and gidA